MFAALFVIMYAFVLFFDAKVKQNTCFIKQNVIKYTFYAIILTYIKNNGWTWCQSSSISPSKEMAAGPVMRMWLSLLHHSMWRVPPSMRMSL